MRPTTRDAGLRSRIVITGGPGAGKTTLIEELARRGYAVMPEAGRAIIQDQLAIGGQALPWLDPQAFAELMLSWDLRSFQSAAALTSPVFFDRGVPDIIGYLRVAGVPVPQHLLNAACRFRYDRTVFAAPPWEEIYTADAQRRQSFDEAQRTYAEIERAYTELGYSVVALPRAGVAGRSELILQHAAQLVLR